MNNSCSHITVTSSYFLLCCTRSKSLQQYGENLFYDCLIMVVLGSALWFLHSCTGCPPMFAWGSFHARNKLLRYQVCMKVKVLLLQTKNGPTGQSEVRRLTYLHQFLFSIFSFPSIKRNGRPTGRLAAKLLFKNVILNNFNDLLPIQFSTASLSLRSSTTSWRGFLKFWRAASRSWTEKQIKKAPKAKLRSFESYDRSQLFDHLSTSSRQ